MASKIAPPRLRHDPTEYAKKQVEKMENAKRLREQNAAGKISENHTFTPKINPSNSNNNNNNQSIVRTSSSFNKVENEDELDKLSKAQNIIKNNNNKKINDINIKTKSTEEPQDDTLANEVKRQTGITLNRSKLIATSNTTVHSSTDIKHTNQIINNNNNNINNCLRNSSCRCPKCDDHPNINKKKDILTTSFTNQLNNDSSQITSSLDNDIISQDSESSKLSLLKSKIKSRRNSQTAPTNSSSKYLFESTSTISNTARDYSSTNVLNNKQLKTNNNATNVLKTSDLNANINNNKKLNQQNINHSEDERYNKETMDILIINKKINNLMKDEEVADDQAINKCSDCGRKFNDEAFNKHQKICAKVFQTKRKQFDVGRIDAEAKAELDKLKKQEVKTNPKGQKSEIKKDKNAKWKIESEKLRNAMKSNKELAQAMKEGKPLPPHVPSAPDPSLILCDHCGRRFNDRAAERHIPRCAEIAKRDAINKAPPQKKTGTISNSKSNKK